MELDKIRLYISDARLQNYLDVCDSNYQKALKLYQANMKLSQSFYPLLSLVEVILRNALNNELTKHFNDENWLLNQLDGFMVDESLSYIDRYGEQRYNYFLKSSVEKSIRNCNKPITQGKIIADLKFGFWTAFFNKTHSRILDGVPIGVFERLPRGFNRKKVNESLDKIREFRNRIYHNEPIIFKMNDAGIVEFNLEKAESIYGYIQDFFNWFNLDFKLWTKKIDRVIHEIENTKWVINYYPLYSDIFHYKEIQL